MDLTLLHTRSPDRLDRSRMITAEKPSIDDVYHHGVKGMKWGVRHDRKPTGRKRAGRVTEAQNQQKRRGLTDNQKRVLKIGGGIAAGVLVAYGGYKLNQMGAFNGLKQRGQVAIAAPKPMPLADAVKNVNPLRGTPEGKNNCASCAIASVLRSMGVDAQATSTGGQMQNLNGVVERCFKGARTIDGTAVTFGRSQEDAAAMIKRKFGDNAKGCCSVEFRGGGGHIFSWETVNGVVRFGDGQNGASHEQTNSYWRLIDPNGRLQLARLDNAEPIEEELKTIVGGSLNGLRKPARVA